jgi:hypothetical protein
VHAESSQIVIPYNPLEQHFLLLFTILVSYRVLLLLTGYVTIGNYSAFKNLLLACLCWFSSVFKLSSYSHTFNPSNYFVIPGLEAIFLALVCDYLHPLSTYEISYPQILAMNIRYYDGMFVFALIMLRARRVKSKTSTCVAVWRNSTMATSLH